MEFTGRPIEIRYRRGLRDTAGNEAHAATFIRERLIVLDSELLGNNREHARILIHEMAHFAWVRLGNPLRLKWEDLLSNEFLRRVRGETGWSAEWRKNELSPRDPAGRTRRWREYICESFCDTAAWFEVGCPAEVTLPSRHLASRERWMRKNLESRRVAL
jgi:hypothetical protein